MVDKKITAFSQRP